MFWAGAKNGFGDVVGHGHEQLLVFAQFILRAFPFGNVAGDGEQERPFPAVNQREHDFHRQLCAVKPIDHPFETMTAVLNGKLDHFLDLVGGK